MPPMLHHNVSAIVGRDEQYCFGPGTDMHMSGFVFGVGDCVVFLLEQWRLDSPRAMGIGLLASAWLGLVYEGLTWARRNKLQTSPWLRQRPWLWTLILTLSYMLQVLLGYLLMLIAMTYQLELLLSAVSGLGLGHAIFNLKAPVGESVEPCCVEPVEPARVQPAEMASVQVAELRRPLLS